MRNNKNGLEIPVKLARETKENLPFQNSFTNLIFSYVFLEKNLLSKFLGPKLPIPATNLKDLAKPGLSLVKIQMLFQIKKF
jgi:hypothetical protein